MWELEEYADSCRCLRVAAIDKGLDPDTTAPEDILLMHQDDKGAYLCQSEYLASSKRAAFYRNLETLKTKCPSPPQPTKLPPS